MKKVLAIILIVGMMSTIVACSSNSSKTKTSDGTQSKKLIVYCPHPVEFINPIVKEFEAKTGVSVEVVTAGTGELLKRVESEKAKPLGDILWGGSLSTNSPKKDLFEIYKTVNEDSVSNEYKNSEGMLTRFTVIPSVIMVNKKLIGDIKIQGYDDVLNPALKGKIAFANPPNHHHHLNM